jgi:hypothetical protein
MNNKNMFVDTISAINVNNGIVKMNLVAQSSEQPITDDNNPPKFDDLGQCLCQEPLLLIVGIVYKLIDKRIAILKAR